MRTLLVFLMLCTTLQTALPVRSDNDTHLNLAAKCAASHAALHSKEMSQRLGSTYGFYRQDICLYATSLVGGERASFRLWVKANTPVRLEALSTGLNSELWLLLSGSEGQAIDLGAGNPPLIDIKVPRDTYVTVELGRSGSSQTPVGCSVAVLTPNGYRGALSRLQSAAIMVIAEQNGMASALNVSMDQVASMLLSGNWLMVGCVLAKGESFKLANIETGDRLASAVIRCDNTMAQITGKLYTSHDGKLVRSSKDPIAPVLIWLGDANHTYSLQTSNAAAETLVYVGVIGVASQLVPDTSSEDEETESPRKGL